MSCGVAPTHSLGTSIGGGSGPRNKKNKNKKKDKKTKKKKKKKLKIELTYNPVILLLGNFPKKTRTLV